MAERTSTESFKVTGAQLLDTVKKVLHEANVRRVIIKHGNRSVVEFPVSLGVVGAVFAPVLAAVGALAAVLTECTVDVERAVEDGEAKDEAKDETKDKSAVA